MDGIDEIVQEFLVESHENLDQLDRDLVALEQDPTSRDLLSSIFRTIHTIKGTSGFLAFGKLESVTHVGENLLSRLRDGALVLTPLRTDVLLRMVDTVRALLAEIESSGGEGAVEIEAVVAAISAAMEDGGPVDVPAPGPLAAPAPEPAPTPVPEPTPEPEPAPTPEPEPTPVAQVQPQAAPAAPAAPAGAADSEAPVRRSAADSTIRVDVELLESLMRLVGELVLTRNQILQHSSSDREVALVRMVQRLNLVTTELQEGVMKTRMQPIDHVWSKLPRVVRDLSSSLGKKIDLKMVGRETELDRTLLEAIKDPLTHIVRNSVDHGIEDPARRRAAGKSDTGTLTLRAFHEGGRVIVEIRDDGGGIDPSKVAAKAIERGIVSAAQVATMTPREILLLVFRPGFSTAEKVTNVSGRGVGMDVVKTNIEKIGGAVDLESVPGAGTTTRLTIPLTLAIVPALTVECGGERYAIPQISLVELVSLDASRADQVVEQVSGAPVYRLRGRLLPLVRLHEVLGMPNGESVGTGDFVIAVLQSEGRRFGLVVDRVLNTEEIVVKPLSSRLKGIGVYSGATILGDGRVALILDAQAIATRSLSGEGTDEHEAAAVAAAAAARRNAATDRFLLTGVGDGRRVAIPLDTVTRLEEFPLSSIEHVGNREVVRYRGEIVPLLRLANHLGAHSQDEVATVPVVVSTQGRRSVALVVEEILDVVDEEGVARSDIDDMGLLGSVVIGDRVTELLDVRQAILAADPNFYAAGFPAGGLDEHGDLSSPHSFGAEVMS